MAITTLQHQHKVLVLMLPCLIHMMTDAVAI